MRSLSIIAFALLLAGCGAESSDAGGGGFSAQPQSLPVRAFIVSRQDLSPRIQVAAPVEPLRRIQLAARTDGIVSEVMVEGVTASRTASCWPGWM